MNIIFISAHIKRKLIFLACIIYIIGTAIIGQVFSIIDI